MAASIFNGAYVKALKNRIKTANEAIVPGWVKYSFDYLDLQTAATNNTIDLHTLLALGLVSQVAVDVTTAFAGTGITALDMTVGPSTDLDKYVPGFNLLSSTTAPEIYIIDDIESRGSNTTLRFDVNSTGANLSALTQGVMDIYLLLSKLPDTAE